MKKQVKRFLLWGLAAAYACVLLASVAQFLTPAEVQADRRMEQLTAALDRKDPAALRRLFSKSALEQAYQFDAQAEVLLGLLDGDILSWERTNCQCDDEWSYGSLSRRLRAVYQVTTAEREYTFRIVDAPVDRMERSRQGLYSLQVVIDTQLLTWEGEPGIYVPEGWRKVHGLLT